MTSSGGTPLQKTRHVTSSQLRESMSQKVLQRLILLSCSNTAQLQSYSPNPTLIWACEIPEELESSPPCPGPPDEFGMRLTGTGNLAPWDENTQGHQTEATYLGEESSNSLPEVVWILIQANTEKNITRVFLEVTPYLRFSASVLSVRTPKQSAWVVYSF